MVSYFAHSLNLVVQIALKSISETRVKVRRIVGHFKRSLQAAEKTKKYTRAIGLNTTFNADLGRRNTELIIRNVSAYS